VSKQLTRRLSPDRYVELAQLPAGNWCAMTTGANDRTRPMIADDPVEAMLALCDLLCRTLEEAPAHPGPGYAGWSEWE